MTRFIQLFFIFYLSFISISSQTSFTDYKLTPREYTLAGISIEGVAFLEFGTEEDAGLFFLGFFVCVAVTLTVSSC